MKSFHSPMIDGRYWAAIALASVFGTNLGDFYAHASGLPILAGLCILALVAAAVFVAERFDSAAHEIHYWLVIIIIRTGATNIADYLAFRMKIQAVALSVGLAVLLGVLAWQSARGFAARAVRSPGVLPPTNATYWLAMLTAGVLGTVLGDVCSHLAGQGVAAMVLSAALGLALLTRRAAGASSIASYWFTVAVARTAGTAIGDWLAENKMLHIGLPLSTVLTGCVFTGVLVLWPRSRGERGRNMLGTR